MLQHVVGKYTVFKPGVCHPLHAWFLEIGKSVIYVSVYLRVCVCAHTPQSFVRNEALINNQ